MSNTKHIPGPWRVFNHSWSDTSILADGFDHAVCLLGINYATEESQEADEAVMAANAALIAAAPELLDVLRCIRERLELSMGDHICAEDVFDSFYREIMDEAIAKAMGAKP